MVEDWWLMCCQARSGVVRCRKTGSIVFLKYYCTPGFFFLECERPLFCHLEFPFLVLCPVLQPLDCKKSSSGSFYVCLFISPGCRTNIFYTTYLYGAYKSIYPWSLSGLVIRLNVIHLLFAVYTQLSRMYCINFVWLLRAAPNIKLVLLFNKGIWREGRTDGASESWVACCCPRSKRNELCTLASCSGWPTYI